MPLGLGWLITLIDMWYKQLIIIAVIAIAIKFIPDSIFDLLINWHSCGLFDCLIWQRIADFLGGFF